MKTCELCFLEGPNVRSGLACYADDGRFDRIERCLDHQACRDRVERSGEPWPLIDITDRSPSRSLPHDPTEAPR